MPQRLSWTCVLASDMYWKFAVHGAVNCATDRKIETSVLKLPCVVESSFVKEKITMPLVS